MRKTSPVDTPKGCNTGYAAWTTARGNVIEDEPRCDANENGKHDYALIRKWASHDSPLFKHQWPGLQDSTRGGIHAN